MYCTSRRQHQRFLKIIRGCLSGAIGSVGVWCSARGVAGVVGSNLARGKIFTASIGSVDSIRISDIYLISLVSLDPSGFHSVDSLRTSDIYHISLVSLDPSGFHF